MILTDQKAVVMLCKAYKIGEKLARGSTAWEQARLLVGWC